MKLISHLKGFSEKESSWLIGRSSALDVVKRYPHVPRLSNVTLTVHTFAFDHHKKSRPRPCTRNCYVLMLPMMWCVSRGRYCFFDANWQLSRSAEWAVSGCLTPIQQH